MSKKRHFTWADYEAAKAALPPNLSPSDYERAVKKIADRYCK